MVEPASSGDSSLSPALQAATLSGRFDDVH